MDRCRFISSSTERMNDSKKAACLYIKPWCELEEKESVGDVTRSLSLHWHPFSGQCSAGCVCVGGGALSNGSGLTMGERIQNVRCKCQLKITRELQKVRFEGADIFFFDRAEFIGWGSPQTWRHGYCQLLTHISREATAEYWWEGLHRHVQYIFVWKSVKLNLRC